MIRYISREQLDVVRYDQCLSQSINTKIYAYSWYLDIVATHWGCLVYDDYKAVMPLPWRKKHTIKYIYIPCWVQQLGVFYTDDLDDVKVVDFICKIPKFFKKITYQFNDNNHLLGVETMQIRQNFMLSLKEDYQSIKNTFSNNRKRILKKTNFSNLELEYNYDIANIIDQYIKQIQPKSGYKSQDIDLFIKLYHKAASLNKAFNWQVWQDDQFLSGVVFFKSNQTFYSILLAQTQKGRLLNANTFIYDQFIKEHQNTSYKLDFEGSNVKGIAQFMQSFGAKNQPYILWQKPFSWKSIF